MISVAFFGTDEFAASTLEALANAKGFKIAVVITQPDRPMGRKQELEKPPVKLVAEKFGFEVIQPETLKNFQFKISNLQLSIVYRYGLIIPKDVLNFPECGTINIHPSMLPRYRGPSPIQTAIMNGDTETGITIMLVDEKMDHGPILAQKKIFIQSDDTYQTLSARMTPELNELLIETIPCYVSGKIKPCPQNDTEASFCHMLSRESGKIDWKKPAQEIINQYRALTLWPGIWTTWQEKRLKIRTLGLNKIEGSFNPGEVKVLNQRILVGTGQDLVEVHDLQLEGKKIMDAKTFLSGYKNIAGSKLC
jgi:methionyl-tRNA formyltransferase